MPLIDVAKPTLLIIDIVAWGVIHAATGYLVHTLPSTWLEHGDWLYRPRRYERDGGLYERLAVKRWKDRLPEAGGLFPGGLSKRSLFGRDAEHLERFAVETRRAELGHWLAALGGPLFFLWNPPGIAAVMVVYAVAVNAPFIVIQRYNRLRIARVLLRSRGSSGEKR